MNEIICMPTWVAVLAAAGSAAIGAIVTLLGIYQLAVHDRRKANKQGGAT